MNESDIQKLAYELRTLRSKGASVAALCRRVQHASKKEHANYEMIQAFKIAFNLSLFDLTTIGGWVGFGSGNPGPSDDDLERQFGPALDAGSQSVER